MQKKILSDQSLEELKNTEKKHKSIITLHTIIFTIFIGTAVYITLEKDFSLYTGLPLLYAPIYIYALFQLKKVKDEIKVRTAHISLQKRMHDNK